MPEPITTTGSNNIYDIVFLYTGSPLPAMLDMIVAAKSEGLNPLLIILDRGENDLIMDSSLIDYDVEVIPVPYKAVEFKRLLSLPKLFLRVRSVLRTQVTERGIVVTNTLDTLLVVYLACILTKLEIRHQIRDLHTLQLGVGLASSVVRGVEKILMSKVSILMVSSIEFYRSYYRKLYSGEVLLLENIPLKEPWVGFSKTPRGRRPFTIGYIGILRYKESIFQLVDAVEHLSRSGMDVRVFFAGGSAGDNKAEILSHITEKSLFDFSGPFEYAKDIQRLYQNVDLIYAVYDSNDLNCQLAMPNKFYESIITRTPILVAADTYVASRVEDEGIGLAIDLSLEGQLRKVIDQTREESSWYRLACNVLENSDPAEMYRSYELSVSRSVASFSSDG